MNEETIFAEALGKKSAARAAFLNEHCKDDAELRKRLEALLRANDNPDPFLEAPDPGASATMHEPVRERPGMVIGPYKLMEEIGEGGFGLIFVAEQQHPVRRKVALKVIKPGMDTREVIARFEAERQALAMMDHPNIAHVLDAGATPSGRPYFVMELVRGLPITDFCDQNHLPLRQRLELFMSVCQAVQHAHQKGIIHRDLKPSNIMVTLHDVTPVVKLIDFGIAKAVGWRLTEKTVYTRFTQMIGTPVYMSPEQAGMSGLDIDTRSDIYALGVVLYVLLTGTTPFDEERLRTAAYDEIRRIIREEDPPKPSTRLSTVGQAATTVAANRHSDPRRLRQLLRGDLDWIVMKALEKDRSRRYETASALAADVRRHLQDEPVEARPPSVWYKFRKFTRRNKTASALAAWVFLTALLAGGGWLWVRHLESAHVTEKAQETARIEREVDFALQEAITLRDRSRLPGKDPAQALAELTAAIGAVKRGESLLAGCAAGEALRGRLSELADELVDEDKDRRMGSRLEEIRMIEGEPVADGRESGRARAFRLYAEAFRNYGIELETLGIEEAGLRIGRRAIRAQLVAILDNCWVWLAPDDDLRRRLRLIADVADPDEEGVTHRMRQALVKNDTATLRELARGAQVEKLPPTTLADLGTALFFRGIAPEAVQLLRRAQLRYPDNFWVNRQLANALLAMRPAQGAEALQFFYASLAVRPRNARTWIDIGNLLQSQNRLADATAAFHEAIACKSDYAWGHRCLGLVLYMTDDLDGAIAAFRQAISHEPGDALTYNNLGTALEARARLDEAIDSFRQAILLKPSYANAHSNLGAALQATGRTDEAIAAYQEAIRQEPNYLYAHIHLGVALRAKGRLDEAIAANRQATLLNPAYPLAHCNLGSALRARGRLDEAIASFQEAIRLQPNYPEAYAHLGVAHSAKGQPAEATLAYQKAIASFDERIRLKPHNAEAHMSLASLLSMCPEVKFRDPARAVALSKKAVELAPRSGNCRHTLGMAHYRSGEWKAALAALEEAQTRSMVRYCPNWFFLAMAHRQLGDMDMACKWYDQAVAWMEKHEPDDYILRGLQDEAASVLRLDAQRRPNESK